MRGLFIIGIFMVFLLGWFASSVYSEYEEPSGFRVYTAAVCEEQEDYILCHDEIFVEYNGAKYQLPRSEGLGSASHPLDWRDPRK